MKLSSVIIGLSLASIAFTQEKNQAPNAGKDTDLLWKKLEARVSEAVEMFDGVMGVAIVDLTDGRAILKNADRVFPTASSIKIAILLELYHQEQEARGGAQGKARLKDVYDFDPNVLVDFSAIMQGLTPGLTKVTNHDLAQFMVATSDNTAANVLIDRVGIENVNATLRSLGLTKTLLRRKMMDFEAAKRGNENVSTPQEMARLLEAIYKSKAVNKELTAEFVKQLSTLKESEIPHGLPEGVQVANKPGSLKGVRNDCGIVFAKNRPFAISVMTQNARDERGAEHAISEIALEAFRYFEIHGKTTEYGRILERAASRN
ncbi:MAG TPA: serine hydrolase [Chthoniobacterales bacterium]|nr:serine hydrolase [Chthoniobacterales bacterium]